MSSGEAREARIKRLRMRSMRRGIKEMDLILVAYAEARLVAMDAPALDRYDALLSENDQDLYQWVSGQMTPPPAHAALIADIRDVALSAAGGVGLAAVELAAHAGCNVIAATGSPEKAEIALAAGAAAAVSYGDDPRAFVCVPPVCIGWRGTTGCSCRALCVGVEPNTINRSKSRNVV